MTISPTYAVMMCSHKTIFASHLMRGDFTLNFPDLFLNDLALYCLTLKSAISLLTVTCTNSDVALLSENGLEA
jgi:hypothetical protein